MPLNKIKIIDSPACTVCKVMTLLLKISGMKLNNGKIKKKWAGMLVLIDIQISLKVLINNCKQDTKNLNISFVKQYIYTIELSYTIILRRKGNAVEKKHLLFKNCRRT